MTYEDMFEDLVAPAAACVLCFLVLCEDEFKGLNARAVARVLYFVLYEDV